MVAQMADQRTDDWFKMRLGLVTGTGFANVLAQGRGNAESVQRRDYRIKLALECFTGKRIEDSAPNADMRRGIELEPYARMAVESLREYMVQEVDFVRHESLQCGVSPDGLVDAIGGLEIKCPKPAIHLEYLSLTDDSPAIYKPQVQGSLMVTGREWWDFASYCREMPAELQLHVVRVYRDETYIENLRRETIKFLAEVDAQVKSLQEMVAQRRVEMDAVDAVVAEIAQPAACAAPSAPAQMKSRLAGLLSA